MTTTDLKQRVPKNVVADEESTAPDKVTAFRRILPQFLASSAKNLLIVDLGLTMAFPSIVIPALTGLNQSQNPGEWLHMTPVQASWLGKLILFSFESLSSFNGRVDGFQFLSKCFVHWTAGWQRFFWFANRAIGSATRNVVGQHSAHHRMGNAGHVSIVGGDLCGGRIARHRRWTHGSADFNLFKRDMVSADYGMIDLGQSNALRINLYSVNHL